MSLARDDRTMIVYDGQRTSKCGLAWIGAAAFDAGDAVLQVPSLHRAFLKKLDPWTNSRPYSIVRGNT